MDKTVRKVEEVRIAVAGLELRCGLAGAVDHSREPGQQSASRT